jgi:type VI secretion system protein ImpA
MAESHVLDLHLLLSPIPGNDPAGAPVADDVRRKLDEMRREPDEFESSAGGGGKKADWPGIINLAESVLTSSSKDLLVAVRLTEALTKADRFAGLQQGLTLLTRLVNDCWDRIHPKPEPGEDYSIRLGVFRWLNDATRGAKFPASVANLQLFKTDETPFSYVFVSETAKPEKREEFERAFESLKVAELQEFKKTAESVHACDAALRMLGAALDQRFGDQAPDLLSQENPDNLGRTLHGQVECVDRLVKKSGLEAEPASASETGLAESGEGAASATDSIDAKRSSRESLYRQVGQIADALSRLEPHSPIPFLLKRIVKLGALPFPELMRELVRENSTLEEFDRLLGIKPEPTA